jgi:predicted MFS family arabinose efflux permease
MPAVWRRLWDLPGWMRVFMAGLVVNSTGALAWIYLSLYLVQVRGLSPAAAGGVSAAYGFGMIAGTFLGGWLGDRYGVRRSLLVSRFGWVVLCLLVPVAQVAALPALVAAAGVSSGAGRPLQFAIVAAALPSERRREGMALSRTASNLGFTLGPPLGALLAAHAFALIFVVDAATTLVIAYVVWRFVPADQPVSARRSEPGPGVWRTLSGDRRVLAILLTVVVVDTAYRQITTPLPLMLRDAGYPPLAYGLLIAANGAIIVMFEAPLAVGLRRRSAIAVIATGYGVVGAGLAVMGTAGLVGASAGIVVVSTGEMLYKPTATAHVADSAPPGAAARYQSLYAGASIAGLLLAPAIGGVAYEAAPHALWPVAGGCALLAAMALATAGRVREVACAEPVSEVS